MAERSGLITVENQSAGGDLTDPAKDQEKLKPDTAEVKIPEISDIPGGEKLAAVDAEAAASPSSADEEGKGILNHLNKAEDDEDLIVTGNETDISEEEAAMLEMTDSFDATPDNKNLAAARLEGRDEDEVELNVDSFGEDLTGRDLDVDSAGQDDLMEEIGEEDEENNLFSPSSEDEDGQTDRQ